MVFRPRYRFEQGSRRRIGWLTRAQPVTNSATATLDAALVKLQSLTVALDAAIVASLSGSASVSATIAAAIEITATLDAVIGVISALVPDEIVAPASNLTDGVNTPAQDLGHLAFEDADWWQAVDPALDTDPGVLGFPAPSGTPQGTQTFELEVRKTAGAANPTLDIELWEAGVFVATLRSGVEITSEVGEIVRGLWDISLVSSPAAAQIHAVGHRSGS